jgi:hypothetical protein
MESPHQGNLVASFLGCIGKWPGTEGELPGFEVSFWTSRDCFGPAEPSNPLHLGNRVGNHGMSQVVNRIETVGQDGNSVAVSATSYSNLPIGVEGNHRPKVASSSKKVTLPYNFDSTGIGEPL